jgi:hypothetical protein
VTVRNNGPSTATGVQLTNALPVGMSFISASSTSGSCLNVSNVVVCSLGSLGSGTFATVTLVGSPTVPGTMTDTVEVFGSQLDVNPANNRATIKTSVQALALRLAHEAGGCVLRWPAPAAGYVLEYAGGARPYNWQPYTATPAVINGEHVLPVTMTNGVRFFRLRAP